MTAPNVSLVIPGRNCASTIRDCLESVVPILRDADEALGEILFVNDGSTDDTATIVESFPSVQMIRGGGDGPGAARNLGWRAARSELIWFIDADTIAEPDTLAQLLPLLDDPSVAGVSGSYGIVNERSTLAWLIHEEIVQRHLRMPRDVTFLATFNVLYRRAALERAGGFDERYLKAQDADLAFRLVEAGCTLRFTMGSRVAHHHPERLGAYLRTQRQQGYWRVHLHRAHRGHAVRGSYSTWVDHLQPPLALLAVAMLPLSLVPGYRWMAALAPVLLAAAQWPMTASILLRTRRWRAAWFAPMSMIRALWRGLGMTHAVLAGITGRDVR